MRESFIMRKDKVFIWKSICVERRGISVGKLIFCVERQVVYVRAQYIHVER